MRGSGGAWDRPRVPCWKWVRVYFICAVQRGVRSLHGDVVSYKLLQRGAGRTGRTNCYKGAGADRADKLLQKGAGRTGRTNCYKGGGMYIYIFFIIIYLLIYIFICYLFIYERILCGIPKSNL
jgi:hypothetical protein